MKRITIFIFCFISLYSNAQILKESVIADTIINDEDNNYNFIYKKCIKLHDNTIFLVRLKGKHDIAFNSTKYDSIQVNTYTSKGTKINSHDYLFTNMGGYIDDITQITNGTIVLVSETRDSTSFIFLDSIGNYLSSKTYSKEDTLQTLYKLYPTSDNQIIVYSQATISTYSFDCFTAGGFTTQINARISKIDSNGTKIWEKQLEPTIMYQSAYFGRIEIFNLKMNAEIDVSNTLDNSLNVIKYSKDSIYGELKIEYLHLDANGNTINRKFLKRNIYNDWCLYNSATFKILNDRYRVIQSNYNTINYFPSLQYDYDINGNLLDSIILSSDEAYYQLALSDKLHYKYFNTFFIKNNLIYTGAGSWPSTGYERTYNLSISNTNWSTSAERDGFSMEDIALINLNDSTLLFINIVDSIYNTTNTKTNVIFHTFSLNDNQIYYSIFIDRNNNGIYDNIDTIYNQALLETTYNNQTTTHSLNSNGNYSQFLKTGSVLSKLVSYEQHLKYYTVTPSEHTCTFSGSSAIDSVFFRLVPIPNIQDLQVSIIPITGARPGFQSTYKVLSQNVGTKTIENIKVKFLKDSLQTIDSFTILPTSVIDDTLIWHIDSMSIYDSREFTVICRNSVPPDLNTNDTLHLFAGIIPFENDSVVIDNLFELKQVVANSIDPNDKIESHGGGISTQQLTNGDYLYYTIRFQNTGTAYATRIKITDTLSDKLNWNTLDILANTNNLAYTIENKNTITWWNNNTYLPDSVTDEINSHGYVSFRIKPLSNLSYTDIIENRAHIFFDYNAAIITNTVTTQIVEQRITNIIQKEIKGIRLYPSPTRNIIQLEFDVVRIQTISLSIVDIQGKELHQELLKINSGLNTIQLNFSDYANGVYFIKLNTDGNNLYYGKVLKQ